MSATIITFPGVRRWEEPSQPAFPDMPVPGKTVARCGRCERVASVSFSFGLRCSACALALVEADPYLVSDVWQGIEEATEG